MTTGTGLICLCGAVQLSTVFTYSAPPDGEVRFQFSLSEGYRREVLRCDACGHFLSVHQMDDSALYRGDYVESTYGDGGIQAAFDRINALPEEKSDNAGRVRRILEFAAVHLVTPARERRLPTVLDVGSGLCVFLNRMKASSWEGTALDSDKRLVAHARDHVGVKAVCGEFMVMQDLGRFDLVTFNKVLEHVRDPVAMLARSRHHVLPGGFAYVEVPDGENAMREGPGREEFFIDHHHIFSAESLRTLAERAGFMTLELERLREPSTKYTLRAFLVPA